MKEKEFPSFFLPIPYLYTQATTIRMPGSGHTFWFYSFVPWVQREYRARLEISYIDFFFKGAKVRPVSNVVLLPCRTQLIEEIRLKHGSSAADVWNQVVLLPWSTARLAVLNLVFIFVFCFRQQSFCSTELNSTSETLGRASVVLQSGATVKPA